MAKHPMTAETIANALGGRKVSVSWMENAVLNAEPFDRRGAWVRLIEARLVSSTSDPGQVAG